MLATPEGMFEVLGPVLATPEGMFEVLGPVLATPEGMFEAVVVVVLVGGGTTLASVVVGAGSEVLVVVGTGSEVLVVVEGETIVVLEVEVVVRARVGRARMGGRVVNVAGLATDSDAVVLLGWVAADASGRSAISRTFGSVVSVVVLGAAPSSRRVSGM